ncbi:TPA: tungsten ABC transporter substrate-binding protein [bacterium]|nr:tungsten ABC transporter substrate-binding protein [bacterium]
MGNLKILLIVLIVFSLGCGPKVVKLATTTSLQDTGLLDLLIDEFHKENYCKIQAIAIGSGQAIQLGKQGEVDILLVHSPSDEIEFMNQGYGSKRTTFMHNNFVILGPPNDPAKVKGTKKLTDAFRKITNSNALFISRADNSGTYKKEKQLWSKAGVFPKNYIETGQGMSRTIWITNEKRGYTLSDKATYSVLKKTTDLIIVYENDDVLINPYSLILVNKDKSPKVNDEGAEKFMNFILSKKAKGIIENFGKQEHNQPLFSYDYQL